MVILDDDDFAELPSASSREIAVEKFVPREQIDPIWFEKSYYLEPEKTGTKPYALLRQALLDADRMAVVTVAIRSRTSMAVLRVRDDVIVLQTMMWPDEVRAADFSVETGDVKPAEVKMANMLVETLAGDFDASEFEDDYAGAVEALVKAKIEGGEVKKTPTSTKSSGEVVDLLAALQRSVDAAKTARGESTERREARQEDGGEEGAGQEDRREEDDHQEGRREEEGQLADRLAAGGRRALLADARRTAAWARHRCGPEPRLDTCVPADRVRTSRIGSAEPAALTADLTGVGRGVRQLEPPAVATSRTSPPLAATASAVASPMPLEAPVSITRLPASGLDGSPVTQRMMRRRRATGVSHNIRWSPSGTAWPRCAVTTTAKAASTSIGSSTAEAGSPRTITSSIPSLSHQSGSRCATRLEPLGCGVEREERAAQERHRQHDEVGHVDRALGGLGDRAGQQPDGHEAERADDQQRDRRPTRRR